MQHHHQNTGMVVTMTTQTYFTEDTATSESNENRFTIVSYNAYFSALHDVHLTSNITFPANIIPWAEDLQRVKQ